MLDEHEGQFFIEDGGDRVPLLGEMTGQPYNPFDGHDPEAEHFTSRYFLEKDEDVVDSGVVLLEVAWKGNPQLGQQLGADHLAVLLVLLDLLHTDLQPVLEHAPFRKLLPLKLISQRPKHQQHNIEILPAPLTMLPNLHRQQILKLLPAKLQSQIHQTLSHPRSPFQPHHCEIEAPVFPGQPVVGLLLPAN